MTPHDTLTSAAFLTRGDVEGLLAFHRAQFGGARMENDGDTSDGAGDAQDHGADGDAGGDDLRDAGKRALQEERRNARQARAERKAAEERAAAAEARATELERAQMDAQTRAESERDDWKKKYEEQQAAMDRLALDILRRDVAAEKGLTPALARRLQGATRDELETDADDLKAQFAATTPPPPPGPTTPRPDPSQGSGHDSKGGRPTTVADAMRDIRARDQR